MCTPSAAPVCCRRCGHRSCCPAAATAKLPPLLLFILHGCNGRVEGSLLHARSRSQKTASTTMRRWKKLVKRRQQCERSCGLPRHYDLVVHSGSARDEYLWHSKCIGGVGGLEVGIWCQNYHGAVNGNGGWLHFLIRKSKVLRFRLWVDLSAMVVDVTTWPDLNGSHKWRPSGVGGNGGLWCKWKSLGRRCQLAAVRLFSHVKDLCEQELFVPAIYF